jgi:hypothetical protein
MLHHLDGLQAQRVGRTEDAFCRKLQAGEGLSPLRKRGTEIFETWVDALRGSKPTTRTGLDDCKLVG